MCVVSVQEREGEKRPDAASSGVVPRSATIRVNEPPDETKPARPGARYRSLGRDGIVETSASRPIEAR